MRKLLIAALAVLALGAFSFAPAFADKGGEPNESSGNTTGGSQNANDGNRGGNSSDNGNEPSGTPGNQGNEGDNGNAGGDRG